MSIYVDHKLLKHLLKKLKDVLISAPADGQVLTYEAASKKWKNKAVGTFGKGMRCYITTPPDFWSFARGSWQTVPYNAALYDDFGEFNAADNSFIPSKTGRYLCILQALFADLPAAVDTESRLINVGLTTQLGYCALWSGGTGICSALIANVCDLTKDVHYIHQIFVAGSGNLNLWRGYGNTYMLFLRQF